jgi:hypothetical protein
MKNIIMLVMLTFAMVATASADSFNYHFAGGGNVADLNLTGSLISANEYLITAGTITVTGGTAVGSYTLDPGGPGIFNSPSGAFQVDDILFIGADPALDTYGLLFSSGSMELNLWGNSPGNYSFYRYNPTAATPYDVQYTDPANDPSTFVQNVPEPASLPLLGAGIACLCVFRMKQTWRQKARARA